MRLIDDITEFIFLEDEPRKADIIIIPGGSYAEIAEQAAELWNRGYAPLILPSGKYSVKRGYFPGPLSKAELYSKHYQTEWEFLKDVLVSNGVDEGAVLQEDQSTSTYENAAYCRKVTDELHLDIRTAIICCKSFHARRCLMYFQAFYPQSEFILCPSDTQEVDRETWFKNDKGIERVLGELARCGNQFVEIIKSLNR